VKKEICLPLVLIGLSAAFIVVSFLVWITRGKDSLLKKKLRIGALILSLSGVGSGCWPVISCYDGLPADRFVLEGTDVYGEIELDLTVSNILKGKIQQRRGKDYWFLITGQDSVEIQTGTLEALDGAFNEDTEEFEIAVRSDIPTGGYDLTFYSADDDHPQAHFFLHIINE
jgi:hypothetical protein